MAKWYMLTVVGKDQSGIVAHLTHALYEAGSHLGEASMMRLGGNFTMMLMVRSEASSKALAQSVETVCDSMGLHLHIDTIDAQLHQQREPDVRISVYGADQPGIVAHVTGALAEAGLHILELESDVAGSEQDPIYLMHIEGYAAEGLDALRSALSIVTKEGIDAHLEPIDTPIS